MLLNYKEKNGQTTLEYAILIVIVIAALFTIQTYVKRGMQGRLKSATDDIGDQFSPGNTQATTVTTTKGHTVQDTFGTDGRVGESKSRLVTAEKTETDSASVIHGDEFWASGEDQPGADTLPAADDRLDWEDLEVPSDNFDSDGMADMRHNAEAVAEVIQK